METSPKVLAVLAIKVYIARAPLLIPRMHRLQLRDSWATFGPSKLCCSLVTCRYINKAQAYIRQVIRGKSKNGTEKLLL